MRNEERAEYQRRDPGGRSRMERVEELLIGLAGQSEASRGAASVVRVSEKR